MKRQVLTLFACVVMLAGCGHTVPEIPATPVLTQTADATVMDAAAWALRGVKDGSAVVNRISKIELTLRPTVPAAADKELRDGLTAVSTAGTTLVDEIEQGVYDTYPKLRDAVTHYIDQVRPFVDIIRNSDRTIKERLADLAEVLLEIAIGILANNGGGFGFAQ